MLNIWTAFVILVSSLSANQTGGVDGYVSYEQTICGRLINAPTYEPLKGFLSYTCFFAFGEEECRTEKYKPVVVFRNWSSRDWDIWHARLTIESIAKNDPMPDTTTGHHQQQNNKQQTNANSRNFVEQAFIHYSCLRIFGHRASPEIVNEERWRKCRQCQKNPMSWKTYCNIRMDVIVFATFRDESAG